MRDLGNSVLVVEHDEDTMRESDYIIDIGSGAGIHGGQVVAYGTPEEVASMKILLLVIIYLVERRLRFLKNKT